VNPCIRTTLLLSALALASTTLLSQQPSDSSSNAIYIHGNILTGAHLRPGDPSPTPARVTAIAVSNGIITAVGTDTEVLKRKTPNTTVVDLHGAFVMPGFNDAHTHIASAGQQKLTLDLDHVPSLSDMQGRVLAFAATLKPGQWITGAGWDHTLWPGKKLPTRADLDNVTGGHPTILTRTDGHIAVVNSAALLAAGITADTPDPQGGKIDRDASGEPTGIIREGPALALIEAKIPKPDLAARRRALTVAMNDAISHGVTSVQDFSDWEDFLAMEEMEHTGNLHLRISEWIAFDTPLGVLKERRASHPAHDPLLHLGMLKAFMDGSLGSRTAALEAPYSDDPDNSGIPRYDQAKLNQMSAERAAAGFQLGFHAIGDRANHMALDAFSAAEQVAHPADLPAPPAHPDSAIVTSASPVFSPASLRLRIEHAQVLLPGDFDRFASEGVIASMQPSHLLTDMNWAPARLGPERVKYSYAWRSFLDHHVTLAFGTDYPVESINPFRGLYAAITRQNEAGTMTYQPQEKITLNEALYAYTQASAFAEFEEKTKGRLEPGYFADFIVLDRDITSARPQSLLRTSVLRTVMNGDTVYTAPSAGGAPAAAGR
jgi:predicted amidohydrolase YtcJ